MSQVQTVMTDSHPTSTRNTHLMQLDMMQEGEGEGKEKDARRDFNNEPDLDGQVEVRVKSTFLTGVGVTQ